jgi:2-phospho-L-lactate guanylyltransferase
MLVNVLTALRNARTLDTVTVVCADRKMKPIVQECGATFLWEGHRRGLNGALNFALKNIPNNSHILIIHADLPLLTSEEVNHLIIGAQNHPLTVVPSKDKTGTNAILMREPNIIRLAFGKGSFQKHINLAKQRRVYCKILRINGVAFDVDEEDDLKELMQHSTETYGFLNQTPELRSRRKLPILPPLIQSHPNPPIPLRSKVMMS